MIIAYLKIVSFKFQLNYFNYNIQHQMGVLKKGKQSKKSSNHFPFQTKKRTVTTSPTISKSSLRSLVRTNLKSSLSLKTLKQIPSTSKLKNVNFQNLQALINQSDCQCPCCLQMLVHPIVLPCKHTYCLKCFEENSVINLRCPLCRQEVEHDDVTPAKTMQNIIERLLLPKTSQFFNYWCRKGDFQEWENVRRVNLDHLRAIDRVDVRTQDGVWRSAVVQTYQLILGQYMLTLRVNDFGKNQIIRIEGSSRNLASYGFFTKKIYLKYRIVEKPLKFMENIDIPQIDGFLSQPQEQHIRVEGDYHSQFISENNSHRQFALELLQHHSNEWNEIDFL